MGKCAKCHKRIEYNNFTVVDGIVYHKECAPKEPVDPEVKLAEEEAEEQFEKDMAEVGEINTNQCDSEEKKPRKKRGKKND